MDWPEYIYSADEWPDEIAPAPPSAASAVRYAPELGILKFEHQGSRFVAVEISVPLSAEIKVGEAIMIMRAYYKVCQVTSETVRPGTGSKTYALLLCEEDDELRPRKF